MSDEQQPEHMRPIPDGGLKDAMPGWLKRPPAWRNVPTAAERHERTLPEPDTSEIDPRTLLDVSDLPQWLQTIAARGEVPVPEPDASVDHAVEQIRAASNRAHGPAEIVVNPEPEIGPQEMVIAEPVATKEVKVTTSPESRSSLLIGGIITAAVVILALLVIFVLL